MAHNYLTIQDIQTPNTPSLENANDLSFPMMYHTVVYTLYAAHDSQFNNIHI